MVKTSFETLPLDMQMQILSRLSLKSLMRCTCVSKKWASLIRGEEFRRDYLLRSMTRPRVLFMIFRARFIPNRNEVLFLSVYQEDKPLLSSGQQHVPPLLSSGQQQVLLSPSHGYVISQPIQGLICLQKNTMVTLFNPGTNKSHRLPEIKLPRKTATITTFFGYDELTMVFKVLCIAEFEVKKGSEVTKEQHILTMRSDEKDWRRIICEHHHSPANLGQGLCTRGVLYYRARSNAGNPLVMSFNVRSEEFSVIELPEDVNVEQDWDLTNYDNDERGWELVNYNGAIALVDDSDFSNRVVNPSSGKKVFHIWVRNEMAGNWLRTPIEILGWIETFEVYYFRGTTRTGEFIFSLKNDLPTIDGKTSLFVVYYDPKAKILSKFKIEGGEDCLYVRTFSDHVESPMFI